MAAMMSGARPKYGIMAVEMPGARPLQVWHYGSDDAWSQASPSIAVEMLGATTSQTELLFYAGKVSRDENKRLRELKREDKVR